MLTTRLVHADGSVWLPSELANQLVLDGNCVSVVNLEWSGIYAPKAQVDARVEIIDRLAIRAFAGRKFAVAFRWAFSSFKLLASLLTLLCRGKRYDLLLCFSPCTALYSAIPLARLICKDAFLVYWDFFPVHNQEISDKIPKYLMPCFKSLESILVRLFPRVGCMSPKNLAFFRDYFNTGGSCELLVLPIWTSFLGHDNQFNISDDSVSSPISNDEVVKFVFGGQLVPGRGIVDFCSTFVAAYQCNSNLLLTICGDGPLSTAVERIQLQHPSAIRYLGALSREAYIELLQSSDVGVVVTATNVSAPTFPSKCLDYMACRLPVLAVVEDSSDFGEIIESNNAGVTCEVGDVAAIVEKILFLAESATARYAMGSNANVYLRNSHSVKKVSELIIGSGNV